MQPKTRECVGVFSRALNYLTTDASLVRVGNEGSTEREKQELECIFCFYCTEFGDGSLLKRDQFP